MPHQAAYHKILWLPVGILVGPLWLGGQRCGQVPGPASGRVEGVWRVPRIPWITFANACRMFGPDRFAPRLHDVPHEELEAAGIRGLIVDLDNTLLGFRETELARSTSPGWPGPTSGVSAS